MKIYKQSLKITVASQPSLAIVKMEIPALKSSILSSDSFQLDKIFWGVGSVTVERSRLKPTCMVAQEDEKFGPEADLESLQTKEKIDFGIE